LSMGGNLAWSVSPRRAVPAVLFVGAANILSGAGSITYDVIPVDARLFSTSCRTV
jgi:hypothetical protein